MKFYLIRGLSLGLLIGGMYLVFYIYHLIPENVWYNHPTAITLVGLWWTGALYLGRFLLTGK